MRSSGGSVVCGAALCTAELCGALRLVVINIFWVCQCVGWVMRGE